MEEEVERKWKDMDRDCLVEILSRVGIESLVFHIPKVCKSWHRASLDPLCWQNLIFPDLSPFGINPNSLISRIQHKHGPSGITAFIKFAVDRSQRSAVSFHVPIYCSEEAFEYVSIRCPSLKLLSLPISLDYGFTHYNIGNFVVKAIKNWKNLEVFTVTFGHMFCEILTQIRLHCKKFVELNCLYFSIGGEEASAIVELMPEIKNLSITHSFLWPENLEMILKGCKGLEVLDVSHNYGFDGYDQKLKLAASHIKTFKCEMSYCGHTRY